MAHNCRNTETPCTPQTPARQPLCSCLCIAICCFILLLIFGLVCFIVGMSSYFAPPVEHAVDTMPLDTRIVSVDNGNCGDFSVSTDSDISGVTLYLLYDRPTSTVPGPTYGLHSTYSLYTNDDVLTEYRVYLVAGSSYELSISVDQFSGSENVDLQLYISLYNDDNTYPESTEICNNISPYTPCSKTLEATNDGEHYLSFSYHSQGLWYVTGEINGVLNKYNYEIHHSDIRTYCDAPCSEEIRYGNHDSIVVTTSNVTDPDNKKDRVKYTWSCSEIRPVGAWVSFVMLVGMFLVMLSIGFIVALCVVLCIRKRTDPEDTEPLIQPYIRGSPIQSGTLPPPQYTAVSENSLRAPPPYTETPAPQSEADK